MELDDNLARGAIWILGAILVGVLIGVALTILTVITDFGIGVVLR